MNLSTAIKVLNAATKKATALKCKMNVAVVDEGGRLVVFARQDGAWIGSIEIAQSKAFTAVAFSSPGKDNALPTDKLGEMAQPGEPLFGIQNTNRNDGIVIFGGGIPLYEGDKLIGAIGVSGSTVENDIAVAEAGVAALKGA